MVQLDVWSDVVCPWCYIGKTRLEKALAESKMPVQIRWRAFELQPDLPKEGVEARPFYAKKFGSAQRVEQIFAQTAQTAAGDGLALRFDRIQRAPNTRLAHQAVKLAAEQGKQDAAVAALFRAHFEEGLHIGSQDVIVDVLGRAGLDAKVLAERLASGAAAEEVLADEQLAADYGISGVPFFVANGKLAVSGAQPPELFKGFLAEAAGQGA